MTSFSRDDLTPLMRAHEMHLGRPLAEALAEMYETSTLDEIADELGIAHGTVWTWFERLGIDTRPRGRGVLSGQGAA